MRKQDSLVKKMLALAIATVIVAGAVIPVVLDVVASSGASGTTLTIIQLAPLFVALLLLVVFAAPLMRYMS